MKLLLDENLSRRLVDRLADLFPGSTHVALAGLLHSPDTSIWEHAKAAITPSSPRTRTSTNSPPRSARRPRSSGCAAAITRPQLRNDSFVTKRSA